jgi:hypothetical protein
MSILIIVIILITTLRQIRIFNYKRISIEVSICKKTVSVTWPISKKKMYSSERLKYVKKNYTYVAYIKTDIVMKNDILI